MADHEGKKRKTKGTMAQATSGTMGKPNLVKLMHYSFVVSTQKKNLNVFLSGRGLPTLIIPIPSVGRMQRQ